MNFDQGSGIEATCGASKESQAVASAVIKCVEEECAISTNYLGYILELAVSYICEFPPPPRIVKKGRSNKEQKHCESLAEQLEETLRTMVSMLSTESYRDYRDCFGLLNVLSSGMAMIMLISIFRMGSSSVAIDFACAGSTFSGTTGERL
jgi:hypothetical protein